ncbi:reactive intermediate/imine deaminase [Photobacterium sp. NCIMB 13483]|uniref:RidA family protein n=1 Tax=Photobacterium sp. NCIMB 13483 TaxID=2022103 RepID=UPI000D16392D|nr:RidA family protein [Photobacterium sp. NCIMB 13483]PST94401.1 reactive intermediate/imine deaminase [Photobacterium sp. NCIMB 13483]
MANNIIKNSRNTKNAPKNSASTQSVAFSHYNNISAQLPLDPNTGKMVIGGIKEQTTQCLNNIKAIVEHIDHTMDDVVKLHVFVKDISNIKIVDEVYKTFFNDILPTRTVAVVASLPYNDALIQMDALISNGEGTAPQQPCALIKVSRNTDKAPNDKMATQTVAFSHYNNLSAQLPIDFKTNEIIIGDIKMQVKQCLYNINTILSSIDHVLDDVVKTTIYIKNINDINVINDVCNTFFGDYIPARTFIVVEDLPAGALLQIDTVVSHGDGTPPQLPEDSRLLVIEANNSVNAPTVPYSHTVAFSHYNHISGQLPLDPETLTVVNGYIQAQTKQCLNNIKAIIESVDHVMDDIVKVNIQLKNMLDIELVDEIYASFFKEALPARTVIGVSAIPMDALIQIDVIVSNCESTPPQ